MKIAKYGTESIIWYNVLSPFVKGKFAFCMNSEADRLRLIAWGMGEI